MPAPYLDVPRLDDATFRTVRRRAIFDCLKWDPQVGDAGTIANAPLVATEASWQELTALGEALARETLVLEQELLTRPELHRALGLPSKAGSALARAAHEGATSGAARLVRFDFHHTTDGWRISEANSDVPGGLNEASGMPALMLPHYGGLAASGDPCDGYVDALLAGRAPGARVALLHATAYTDDHQMMAFLARRLRARGAAPMLASPAHVRWRDGRAFIDGAEWQGEADLLVRFFPADWLTDLPGAGWQHFYAGGRTPVSNPATALLTQTKRAPLLWDALRSPLPTWRALLPETRDPRDVPWRESDEWIIKPALGRVGEDVAIRGITGAKEWAQLQRDCMKHPAQWVAQRRFQATPLTLGGSLVYPCVGVYTVDARVVGAYGRLGARPLIDGSAQDAAVLIGRRAVA